MADIKTLEHSTLKVPYELLNKQFRSSQKVIDREVAKVNNACGEVEKKLKEPSVTVGDVTTALTSMVDNLSMLKRKAEESIQDEVGVTRVIKRRLAHLQEARPLGTDADSTPSVHWQKMRLDRMLVEYFLRAGYYNSALRLAKHSNIQDLTNIELFMMSKAIEDSLASYDTKLCINWCMENRSKLRKMKSTLEFNIRKQEFIELIRENKRLEAIKHARKYFASIEGHQVNEVQILMGMLAFDCKKEKSPYSVFMDKESWNSLVQQFRYENFKLHQLNSTSVFTATLQTGLSALKTIHCYKEKGEGVVNTDCPVCGPLLNEMAEPLPFAHCANSKLVCHITGLPLNEHNPPMMLPNGRIYGLQALDSMATDNEGQVICPRTQEIFHMGEAEKVFVM